MTQDAPLAGARAERADAARNRARILEAARSLFAERGVGEVTLEEVARAAGAGKATLFRHVSWLLGELSPKADPDLLAHLLLAAFDAELLTALQDQGRDEASVRDAIR